METSKETRSSTASKINRRCRSPYPKKLPTYVVAFALKETYDDPGTTPQMICKLSPQESVNSITPTNSLKLLEDDQTEIVDQTNLPENNNEMLEHEVKVDTKPEKDIINGDKTNDGFKAPKEEEYNETNQPMIIFNATNFGYKHTSSKFSKQKSKQQRGMNAKFKIHKYTKLKNSKHFESGITKKSLNSRLEKYYETAKNNSNTERIPRRILKKVSAKENLFDETQILASVSNKNSNNMNDNLSSHSLLSKLNGSFDSNCSGRTLIRKPSIFSYQSGKGNTGTIKSAIQIASENTIPYKNDVINVAVAVAYNKSKVKNTIDEVLTQDKDFTHLGLTSTETLTGNTGNLTSQPASHIQTYKSNEGIKIKHKRSPNKRKSSGSDDSYDMARTSSELNDLSNDSTYTLKTDETAIVINPIENKENVKKQTILQTVINLGYYPDVTPSTSSAAEFDGVPNVILTEHVNDNNYPRNNNKGDQYEPKRNVFRKQYHEGSPQTNKNLRLPNEDDIKALIDENVISDRKCGEEVRHPASIPELWDKLTLTLDVTLRRFEKSITENILKEIRKVFNSLDYSEQDDPQIEEVPIIAIEPPTNKLTSAQNFVESSDLSLQCELVKKNIIDEIIKVSSLEHNNLQANQSKRLRDYLEGLKSPITSSPQVLSDKGDMLTISAASTNLGWFRKLQIFVTGPTAEFFRENMFVITSVPAFFVMLFFVYSALLMILKPW